MDTFELAKEYLTSKQYKILDEDRKEGHIAFRYQMNTIHFIGNADDNNFFYLSLPGVNDVTEDNLPQVKELCHKINRETKLVKLYVLDDVLVVATEIYYLAKEDFVFQMTNALKHLIAAKIKYYKLCEG